MNNKELIDKMNKDMNNGFILNNNYKLLEINNNSCIVEGIITDTSKNNYNIAHGGYIFGLADTAAGIAAMSKGWKAVTLSSNINYIKKAKGNKLIAEAKCLKQGKTISNYEVSIYDEENNLIAKSTIEYFYIE